MHPDTAIGRDMPRLEATVQPALELTAATATGCTPGLTGAPSDC
jgi:hypothetical protein